jgi:hypothetical protein
MYNLAIQPFFACPDFSAALPVAARLQLIHDGLPCAFHKCGVAGREIGAGKVQV